MELTIIRASGQKQKCHVPGCNKNASFVIIGVKPAFAICESCLCEVGRAIAYEIKSAEKVADGLREKPEKSNSHKLEKKDTKTPMRKSTKTTKTKTNSKLEIII